MFLLSHLLCYLSYFIVMLLLFSYFYFYLSYYFCLFIFRVLSLFLLFIGLGAYSLSVKKNWAQNGLRWGPKLEPNDCHTSQTASKRSTEPNKPLSNPAIRPTAHKKQTMCRLALEAQKQFFLLHVRGLFLCMLVMQCSSLATHVISARIVARHILQQLQKFNGCFLWPYDAWHACSLTVFSFMPTIGLQRGATAAEIKGWTT